MRGETTVTEVPEQGKGRGHESRGEQEKGEIHTYKKNKRSEQLPGNGVIGNREKER